MQRRERHYTGLKTAKPTSQDADNNVVCRHFQTFFVNTMEGLASEAANARQSASPVTAAH